MTRATIGNALNYLTTLGAQVLFAHRFGAGQGAAAYVVVFGVMAAVSGVFTSTVMSLVLPRLLDAEGRMLTGALRLQVTIACAGAVMAAGLWLAAPSLTRGLSSRTTLGDAPLVELMRIGALSMLLQLFASQLAAVCVARGWRLLPAAAPGVPSTATMVVLASSHVDAVGAYGAFAAGSAVEVAILAFAAVPRTRLVDEPITRLHLIAAATLLGGSLLALVPALERIVAATHAASDASHYDYAARSLLSVQSILVTGIMLGGLGTWSQMVGAGRIDRVRTSVERCVAGAVMSLSLAAAIALVAAGDLVALVYQHGAFNAADTEAVRLLVVLSLPGFLAQGVGVVCTSALAATRHNAECVTIGFANVGLRTALIFILSALAGVAGLAVAYSVTMLALTAWLLALLRRRGLWAPAADVLWMTLRTALGTLAVAGALYLVDFPGILRALVVVVTFCVLAWPDRRHVFGRRRDRRPSPEQAPAVVASSGARTAGALVAGGD